MPKVVDVYKTGGYGTTVWFHSLECGHVVSARRRSTKPELPCSSCDLLAGLPSDDSPISVVERDITFESGEVHFDAAAGDLRAESSLELELAHRLKVPLESITAVVIDGQVQGVRILLAPPQINALLHRTS